MNWKKAKEYMREGGLIRRKDWMRGESLSIERSDEDLLGGKFILSMPYITGVVNVTNTYFVSDEDRDADWKIVDD